jgi:hypothetical protein
MLDLRLDQTGRGRNTPGDLPSSKDSVPRLLPNGEPNPAWTAFDPSSTTTAAQASVVRPAVKKGLLQSLVDRALHRPVSIDGVTLPDELSKQLDRDRTSWLKHGGAPGPMFVNGDLARQRYVNEKQPHHPSTLSWLDRQGATELHAKSLEALIGADLCVTPATYQGGRLFTDDTHRGVLTKASERMGFVRLELALADGTLEVPCYGKYESTSYCGVLHGHMIREMNHGAMRDRDYRGLTVYARAFHGGDRRSVDEPAIGEVVSQDATSLVLRTATGEELRFEKPGDGFLQVIVVPSTNLSVSGTKGWMGAFDSLEQMIGQRVRIHFDPVRSSSSVVGTITGAIAEGAGVRLQYRSDEGLDLESVYSNPAHVVLSPALGSVKLEKGKGGGPSFLGQMVDAMLVASEVKSSGYGARWWVEDQILETVRGQVVHQDPEKMVVRAANGETVTLDLGPLEGGRPLTHIHDCSATPYIFVSSLGLWAPKP